VTHEGRASDALERDLSPARSPVSPARSPVVESGVQRASEYHRVNGIQLVVHRFRAADAAPSGLTLLLVHGFMDAGATWDLVASRLARAGHEVIAPDLRGFGESDRVGPGGYYHFADYVADLSMLVDAIAPARLGLVGHSMGGAVSALFTGARPARVERLALLEGLGPPSSPSGAAIDRMRAWLADLRAVEKSGRKERPLASLDEAMERLARRHPRVARKVIESRARMLTRTDEHGTLCWVHDALHRTTSPVPFNAEVFGGFLSQITCPTLAVSGGPEGFQSGDDEARLARIPSVTTLDLPNAGHMMHWTAPEALSAALLAFFGEPPPPVPTASA
jgi:pimeloyl-ACP methyl ester carboxylesterase